MGEDVPVQRLHASDSVDVEDVELPEELVRDEADREVLLQMTEVEREVELAERAEKHRRELERQRLLDLAEATAEDKGGGNLGKRSTEELRAQNETSSEEELTFASQTGTPTAHRETKPDESPSEKETDESDAGAKEAVENEADFRDYLAAQIFRSDLERWILEPHFEESVMGCFVRLHGSESARAENSRNEYMMVEITDCQQKEDIAPYKFGPLKKLTKFQVRLKRASTEFWSGLNVISNAEFTEKEFQEWVQVCKRHKRPLPSKEEMEDRKDQIDQARKFVFTHVEVKKILDEKRKQGQLKTNNAMQRARFIRMRDYYQDQQDAEKVMEFDAKIKELEAKADAQRKALSLGVVDKQAAAREKQLKAETLEAQMDQRRPRVLEKFARKLRRLPHHRRPKALLEFYGPMHPLCANLRESDVKRPFLKRSPSPDIEPPLPDGVVLEPDIHRDLSFASMAKYASQLTEGLKRLADGTSKPDALICEQLLNRWGSSFTNSDPSKRMKKEDGSH